MANCDYLGYDQLMAEHRSFMTVDIDCSNPLELNDFVGLFAAVSSQFEGYMKSEHPDLAPNARFFVKDVRKGSIIADLFPGGVGDTILFMDQVVIVVAFAGILGRVILGYAKGIRQPNATKRDLADYLATVRALAKYPKGNAKISTTTFQQGVTKTTVAFEFDNNVAREAAANIELHKIELDKLEVADHERKLMYFTRSDIGDVSIGKPSGERVVIEDISEKSRPLFYASNLSEQRIKHEIRDTDDNIYKKAFIVDVNVQTKNGRPVGYAITNVHQVVDLSDDED